MTVRAIAALLVPVSLGLAGLTVFFATHSRKQALQNLEESSEGLAVATVLTIQNAMLSGEPKHAKEALISIGQMSIIKRVSVLDIEGDLFADSAVASDAVPERKEDLAALKREVEKLATPIGERRVELNHSRDGSPFFRAIVPIPARQDCLRCHDGFAVGEAIGFLAVDRRAAAELDNVAASVRHTIALGACVLLLLALSIVTLMRGLVRPIQQTVGALEAVAGGDLGRRLPVDSEDELGRMATAFNTATQALGDAREQAQRLALTNELLLRTASDGIHVLDVNGNLRQASDSFCRMLGYTQQEVMQLNVCQWDARWSEQDLKSEVLPRLLQQQELFETKHRRSDGKIFDVEISAAAVVMNGERLLFAASRDITERKQAEANLRISAAELAESNRLKDIFTDVLRHDIINPVSVINMYSSILIKKETDAEKLQILQRIRKTSMDLHEMTEHAARLALVTDGEALECVTANPVEILRSMLPDFDHLRSAKNITLTDLSGDGFLASFSPMMKDVFANLISNAIKYSPNGTHIHIAVEDRGDSWLLSVRDQGNGVPDEHKEGIFNRFQRLNKEGVAGTGLGLTITREIVILHGGEIWVDDNPTGGSIFFVKVHKNPKAAPRKLRAIA